MSTPALRTEQVYVTRGVRNGLDALAMFHCSAQPEGAEGPSIGAVADGLADQILRDYLEQVPDLAAKRRDQREAMRAIDAKYAQQQP